MSIEPTGAKQSAKLWPADDSGIPVSTRAAILECLARHGKPLGLEALARALEFTSTRAVKAIERRLQRMERDGLVLRNRRGLYGLPQRMNMVYGRVVGHADGFGFVVPEQGGGDLFLPPRQMRKTLHGDRVLARVTREDARGRREGAVVEVLESRNRHVVGHFFVDGPAAFVAPDDRRINQDILIPAGAEGGARDRQIVMAEITQQPLGHRQAVGRVIEVLGDHLAPGMETDIAIRKYDLPHVWPAEALAEAQASARAVEAADAAARADLRDLPLVTIDGEDARDFDDAVFCERHEQGWRLVVAIADVSHYVPEGGALDAHARLRGNSVYFPDRVVPMLPEALSTGICSLNPDSDRLCFACDMIVDPAGGVASYRFFEAVMRSQARLTYTAVAAALEDSHGDGGDGVPAPLLPHLRELHALYGALHAARRRRGSIDLDLPESRVVLDEASRVRTIEPLLRNDAHRLIEECMLAANTSAADFLSRHGRGVYRVHDEPGVESVAELRRFVAEFGLALGGGDSPTAADVAALVAATEARPEIRELIQAVILRSMSQAVYRAEKSGHFALGYDAYSHFTSPIRRYPDLVVHRLIKRALRGGGQAETPTGELAQVAEHCSMTERRADDATRDVIQGYKAEFMLDKIGEEFDAVITGVVDFGIFVQLCDIHVDGLVHVTALGDDYFRFDPRRHRLAGDRTAAVFRLGDRVRVRTLRVDLDTSRIDFELVGDDDGRRGRRRRRRAR